MKRRWSRPSARRQGLGRGSRERRSLDGGRRSGTLRQPEGSTGPAAREGDRMRRVRSPGQALLPRANPRRPVPRPGTAGPPARSPAAPASRRPRAEPFDRGGRKLLDGLARQPAPDAGAAHAELPGPAPDQAALLLSVMARGRAGGRGGGRARRQLPLAWAAWGRGTPRRGSSSRRCASRSRSCRSSRRCRSGARLARLCGGASAINRRGPGEPGLSRLPRGAAGPRPDVAGSLRAALPGLIRRASVSRAARPAPARAPPGGAGRGPTG
jgi:hypothetical protein